MLFSKAAKTSERMFANLAERHFKDGEDYVKPKTPELYKVRLKVMKDIS